MDRCDFSSVIKIIKNNISEDRYSDQLELMYALFDSFVSDDESSDYSFDNGLVSRWISGQTKISGKIVSYYLERKDLLEKDISENIVPALYDIFAACGSLYELATRDSTISAAKRQELVRHYPHDHTAFITDILCFGMERGFIKRDAGFKKRLSEGSLSPSVRDYLFDCEVPRPCSYFCGRDDDIKSIHSLLQSEKKVFLQGIAGIGKSELAKAYANQYRKEYTNIIFLNYSGSLYNDILNIDFSDDLPDETPKKKFHRHNLFLKSLKEDSLLIIDNFNATALSDEMLSIILNKYRCRILFTSRSHWERKPSYELTEIRDPEKLFSIVKTFFDEADKYIDVVYDIIETVHMHTYAVDLIARLLAHGILSPNELLIKLQQENVALSSSDMIDSEKDGVDSRQTYHEHIRLLFSLFKLSEDAKYIMRNMAFSPSSGVPARLFAKWLDLQDMNSINELTSSGFIKETPGYTLSLHPMMKEVTIDTLDPTVSNCRRLIDVIDELCLHHGESIAYYKIIFQIAENIADAIRVDDSARLLVFLEDVIMYMENYNYSSGISHLTERLQLLLSNADIGTDKDRALLLLCQTIPDKYSKKSLVMYEKALKYLPEVNEDNAALISNIHSNMSTIYQSMKKIEPAMEHLKTAVSILDDYGLLQSHDGLTQYTNFGMLLYKSGDIISALQIIMNAERLIRENGSIYSRDYASVLTDLGILYLSSSRIHEAVSCFNKAIQIISIIWADDPDAQAVQISTIEGLYNDYKKILMDTGSQEMIARLPELIIPYQH